MKLKDRIKTYNFWVSLSSAIFLLIKLLGNQFGFSVNESLFNDLITTLCGILVILGIIVPPTNKMTTTTNDNNITSNEASTETNIDKLAKYAGSFILEEGGQLIAPNLVKCNSIILSKGAKAYCPNLRKTENGWFGENDYKRNGTIFVDKGCLIYAPYCVPKIKLGDGEFLRKLPSDN